MPDDAFQRERPTAPGAARPLPGDGVDLRQADGGGISTMIPYTNPKALTAYYLGVFSLIPCLGLLLGPPALVLGILGLQYVNANPTAKGTAHAWIGVIVGGLTTLGNVGVAVAAAIGLLFAR